MKNLKMSAEEAKEYSGGIAPSTGNLPLYPYGTRIELNSAMLEKLGITDLPKLGTKMRIEAMVEVCSGNQYQEQDGDANRSVGLQITDMELSAEKKSNPAKALYGEKE